jgi:hypothetical protein
MDRLGDEASGVRLPTGPLRSLVATITGREDGVEAVTIWEAQAPNVGVAERISATSRVSWRLLRAAARITRFARQTPAPQHIELALWSDSEPRLFPSSPNCPGP